MALASIVYWRDIPAQVIVKRGRESAKRHLGERFEQAIDRAAMRAGLRDSDAYLGEWRRGDPIEVGEALEEEAERLAAATDAAYPEERLQRLVLQGGSEAEAGD